ncbi:MAG TPA: hypothetical protein VL793_04995, partial [Patescibacteria group bacterium]|nr:hypothetical protein [Patescibacteria group bacterium]
MFQNSSNRFLSSIAAIAVFVSCAACAQNKYQVQDLGVIVDLPGRTDSGPIAINRSGIVAGVNVTNGFYQAMIFDGTWKPIGTLGGNESLAAGIDDAGRVVGSSQTAEASTNAFLWSDSFTNGLVNPQMKNIGTLGGPVSEAYSINDSGKVTGYSDVPARPSPQQHAFVYAFGQMTDISTGLFQIPNSFGYAINSRGHVAGAGFDIAYTSPHVFFFDGTNAHDLGTFGGIAATALALNDSDVIAGYLTTTSVVDHAFGYIAGSVTDLGTLGGHYSYALGINNSNVVVGGSFIDFNDQVYHAFIWKDGSMQDLNAQLDSTGAGWNLTEARAINDAGQIIGVGTLNGMNHGFLLSPA